VGKSKQIAVLLSLVIFLLLPAKAQEREDNQGEVAVMSGATLGRLGTHAVVAGSAGASFSKYITGVAEVAVIPMNNRTLLPTAALAVQGSDLFDFNFALHGGVPIKRWEPYGIFGMAVLMNPYSASLLNAAGAVVLVGERHSKFALEYGGGGRYWVGDRWGIRAEYRYTSSVQNFNRLQAGVFYRIEGYGVFGFLPAFAHRLTR
jgi:hypothetical protein